jgi:hypothetical protein
VLRYDIPSSLINLSSTIVSCCRTGPTPIIARLDASAPLFQSAIQQLPVAVNCSPEPAEPAATGDAMGTRRDRHTGISKSLETLLKPPWFAQARSWTHRNEFLNHSASPSEPSAQHEGRKWQVAMPARESQWSLNSSLPAAAQRDPSSYNRSIS